MSDFSVKVVRNDLNSKKLPINIIQISCFKADSGHAMLTAYPGEDRGSSVGLIITSGECVKFEPMNRLNRKRLETIESLARESIKAKSGMAWNLVVKVCEKHNLTVLTCQAN